MAGRRTSCTCEGIQASILDLNATIKPHFTIVDAVTAMEGDGPIMGRAESWVSSAFDGPRFG